MSALNGLRINVWCFVYPCYKFRKFEHVLCKYSPRLIVIGIEKYNFPISVCEVYIMVVCESVVKKKKMVKDDLYSHIHIF
jgi:hypothetical protein